MRQGHRPAIVSDHQSYPTLQQVLHRLCQYHPRIQNRIHAIRNLSITPVMVLLHLTTVMVAVLPHTSEEVAVTAVEVEAEAPTTTGTILIQDGEVSTLHIHGNPRSR